MSKSAIYAINSTTGTAVAEDGVLPISTIIRRFGSNLNLVNGAVILNGCGYYDISAVVTVTATAVGLISAALYLDGVQIPGAISTVTASAIGGEVTIPVSAIVRLTSCAESVVTIVIGEQAVTNFNTSIEVVKL